MAQARKRMFSNSIVQSGVFLSMPPTARLLYYDLGMTADDDGYVEYFGVMRLTNANPDDLKILQAKKFIQVFDEYVLIVLDWKVNNTLRKSTYTPSLYLDTYPIDKSQSRYTNVAQSRVAKSRKDKKSLEQKSNSLPANAGRSKKEVQELNNSAIEKLKQKIKGGDS